MLIPITPNYAPVPYDGLTRGQREVVAARAIDGDSWGSIAFRRGVTRKAVRFQFRRGLRRLLAHGWAFRGADRPAASAAMN